MNQELTVVDENSTTQPISQFDMVDVEAAAAAQKNFGDLVEALLDKKTDYQGGKKKKSAWRKLARAFNISDEPITKEIIRDENYQIISAYFEVKAVLPNGRSGFGVGDCSIFDKVKSSDAEIPSNFELRKRFTNAEHDVIATAHTRAKSRAIADLIGAGEVSAEEMEDIDEPVKVSRSPKRKSTNSQESEAPKTSRRRTRKRAKQEEAVEAEVIETKGEEVEESSSTNPFDEACEKSKAIKKAVARITEAEEELTVYAVNEELYSLYDLGEITIDEYYAGKEVLGTN